MTERLLVVDDNAAFGELVGHVGRELGYEVLVASSSRSFEWLYESFNPTIVSLDMSMPDMDGLEVVRFLADRGSTANIIVISGFGSRYQRAAKAIAGAQGLPPVMTLSKPASLADLRAVLRSAGSEAGATGREAADPLVVDEDT